MRLYDWDPEEGAWDASFDEYDTMEWCLPDRPIPVCSPVFEWMDFPFGSVRSSLGLPVEVRLRPSEPHIPSTYATAHPIATRSFATFPSVRCMRFHYYGIMYGTKAQNSPSGVTVWDVLRSIETE